MATSTIVWRGVRRVDPDLSTTTLSDVVHGRSGSDVQLEFCHVAELRRTPADRYRCCRRWRRWWWWCDAVNLDYNLLWFYNELVQSRIVHIFYEYIKPGPPFLIVGLGTVKKWTNYSIQMVTSVSHWISSRHLMCFVSSHCYLALLLVLIA